MRIRLLIISAAAALLLAGALLYPERGPEATTSLARRSQPAVARDVVKKEAEIAKVRSAQRSEKRVRALRAIGNVGGSVFSSNAGPRDYSRR